MMQYGVYVILRTGERIPIVSFGNVVDAIKLGCVANRECMNDPECRTVIVTGDRVYDIGSLVRERDYVYFVERMYADGSVEVVGMYYNEMEARRIADEDVMYYSGKPLYYDTVVSRFDLKRCKGEVVYSGRAHIEAEREYEIRRRAEYGGW